jgi:hypothetical protein
MDAASALTPDASAAAPATDMADASNTMEPYMGTTPGATEGDAGAVPVSEDTVAASPAATDTTGGAADVTAMPGVVPVAEADAGSTMPAEPAPMPAPPMPAMPAMAAEPMAGGGSTAAWATEVLRQLEEAQASMAKGDWVAYGTSMSALKAYLESVVKGTAAEVAGMDVTAAPVAMPAAPAAMPALEAEAIAAPTTAPADGVAAGAGAGSGMARLVVIATGAEMPLPQQEEITVGREDPSSGIFPDIDLTPYGGEDGGVSRRHARLLHVGGDYFVEDLQSTNYTKLDGQRLPARVREKLEDGARLDFGRVAMIFRKG